MGKANIELGQRGEDLACKYLRRQGYKVLKKNFRTRYGQIDIIAKDKNYLCFVEVKTRSSCFYGLPQEAVSGFKQAQISKTALTYLKKNRLMNSKARFDVISILFNQEPAKVHLIKNAFELEERYAY